MRRTGLLSVVFGLLVTALLLAGCTLRAAPDVTPTPSEGQIQAEGMDAVEATAYYEATLTATAPTPVPTEVPTQAPLQPTVEPTAVPTEAPTEAPTTQPTVALPAPTPSGGVVSGEQTYTVQRGDTLYSIARRYGTNVAALAALNGIVNPHHIRVGQVLRISGSPPAPSPGPQGVIAHVVQPGENLFRIALRYNLNYVYLASYNSIANPNAIYVGQVIRIPVQ
jgi:LysM repeat protein